MEFTLKKRYQGIVMVVTGAALWGISGTVAQILFQQEEVPVGWMVTVRLLVSGLLLLVWGGIEEGRSSVWKVFHDRMDRIRIIVFGLAGMLGVQYTYFAAIQTGNAAMATLLQYLSPIYIMIYLAVKNRRRPRYIEMGAFFLALVGIFLLVTNGTANRLSVPGSAVFWGILAGFTAAFYTLFPVDLFQRYGVKPVVGWGMIVGGLGLSAISPPWDIRFQEWSSIDWVYAGFIILFGTLIPFYLFMESLRRITPTEASLLSSAEPLAAILASVFWLNVPFHLFELIGGICIIGTVYLLTRPNLQQETQRETWQESMGG
jgi:drug/metabolite transporter (DMT)-like permease